MRTKFVYFLLGFCVNAVVWRFDQHQLENINYPIGMGLCMIAILAIDYWNSDSE